MWIAQAKKNSTRRNNNISKYEAQILLEILLLAEFPMAVESEIPLHGHPCCEGGACDVLKRLRGFTGHNVFYQKDHPCQTGSSGNPRLSVSIKFTMIRITE